MSARLRPVLDAVLLGALCALALLGFRTTFAGWTFWLVGVLGVLLGVLLAQLAHVLRQPVITLAALTIGTFFLSGGAVALRADGARAGLPLPPTLKVLLHQVLYGWKELLTTLPPVEADGPLIALPYLLGLLAGASAVALATRTRSAVLPVLAPTVLLAVVILLGVQTPQETLLRTAAFAALALVFVAVRAARVRPVTRNGSGRLVRHATAAVLVAAATAVGVLLGPGLPGTDSRPRLVLRSHVVPPFDIGQYPSPLAAFRRYTKPQETDPLYDRVLYDVRASGGALPTGTRLRLATLDHYDGLVWGASNTPAAVPGEVPDTFQRVGSVIDNPGPGRPVSVTLTVKQGAESWWLPTVGELNGVRFEGIDGPEHAAGFRYNLATGTGVVPDGLRAGDTVRMSARLPDTALRPTDTAAAKSVAAGDDGPCPTVVQTWVKDADSGPPLAQVRAVAAHLKTGAYSDGGRGQERFLPGHSTGRLQSFACAGRQLVGNDEQYAALMALAANQLSVPARVVLGAEVPANGRVRGQDMKAWVELETADGTWRVLPTEDFLGRAEPDEQPPSRPKSAAGTLLPPPAPVHPPASVGEISSDELNRKSRSTDDDGPGGLPAWLWKALLYGGFPLLLVGGLLGSVVGVKATRRRRRRSRGSPAARVAAGWHEILDHAHDLGRRVPPRSTRREQAVFLGLTNLRRLAAHADRASFGPDEPAEAQVHEFWADVDRMRATMSDQAGRRRALLARFDVRTLGRSVRSRRGARA